ncbi:5-oxoprolinase subunit PxpA [Acidisoma cellulosilytica]|uniref:5-oxoprolinase subunit A n=1 Tax=Acidisoma cellulosilyticum TaxID=2802395 RepID=A0A963Z422_9PROT|nr:5-oxoprolinase subunit PxpA [Acidisoma cellulosilyticum]MCB8882141.1 5-oxoprolinase subunit PxpA [Acidisoma cellulosilyticum]
MKLDLNSDLGESFGAWTMGHDEAMLDIVTSANIACGFHAGDPLVMHRTMVAAQARSVSIGAHPGFLDLWGFGRRPIQGDRPEEIEKMVIYQIGAAAALAQSLGLRLAHIKAHGALANQAMVDPDLARALARATRAVDRDLIVVVMPGLALEKAALAEGLLVAREVYADRTYDDDGNLTSRKKPGAVIEDADVATQRILAMLDDGAITTTTGKRLPIAVDTICVHGDNTHAVAMAGSLRAALDKAGCTLAPFPSFLRA